MRAFISHSSKDKPAVETLARGLRARGIDAWFDKWEIGPGDDIVAAINRGLDEAEAGVIAFSSHSRESRWVDAEVSTLTYARIQEGKVLIPVMVTADAWVPPLLRPLARRHIDEVDAIADALLGRRPEPPPLGRPEWGSVHRVDVRLSREPNGAVRAAVVSGEAILGEAVYPAIPGDVVRGREAFVRGFRAGVRRSPTVAERASQESALLDLGQTLGRFCLPGDAGQALAALVDGAPVGTRVEICFQAGDTELLGLPFEATRLADGRLLATHPAVVTLRRPAGLEAPAHGPMAGPLKVLVAVGAPDEVHVGGAVLNQEQELQNILDAVEKARQNENFEVRILEVGHPEVIGAATTADAYHVLHISCHGLPGALQLEDEEGRPVHTTPDQLVEPIRRSGRPLPLVLLNACHGGVHDGETVSVAEALLRAGVPAVLAMQTSVSDHYAVQFARAFYRHLAERETLLPSHALAAARTELEKARLESVARGAALEETQPEYATAALYVAGEERPLADFGKARQPLSVPPVYDLAGPVPQLRIDDLIGRRRELREVLRTLRSDTRYAGVVLTGIGGVGKSAIAGRAMQRLAEDGWKVAADTGIFSLSRIAEAVGGALLDVRDPRAEPLALRLLDSKSPDVVRLQSLAKALGEHRVVLVLDDFEQNLTLGGDGFRDPAIDEYLRLLASNARRGRLLLTCRYPVPGAESFLHRVPVGPLSLAETRKLLLRLEGLRGLDTAELARVLSVIGGHPRTLEFLEALFRGGGSARLPHVTERLTALLAESGLDPETTGGRLDESLQATIQLAARSVLLEDLLGMCRDEGLDEVLLHVAVSNLPVPPAGVPRMLPEGAADEHSAKTALARLANLSLLHRFPDGSAWVHRWTAEGLETLSDPALHRERCTRAALYRWWRVEHESHELGDAVEAVRNFLDGEQFDDATGAARACIEAMRRFGQTIGIAALAAEVLERLPEAHARYAALADEEAQANLALGFTTAAQERYEALLTRQHRLANGEPGRADYQRTLSVFFSKLGNIYRTLGQGDKALKAFLDALAIAERLANAEPGRADYQRDLSISFNKLGDIYRDLGQGDKALEYYARDLEIAERLANAEPGRADYQRDLSVSFNKLGDIYHALGQGDKALKAFLDALAIRERLAIAEPGRADYQRDLSVSFNNLGGIYRALGQGGKALEYCVRDLEIAERLANAEPDRADYQRDLSVSFNKLGDIYRDLGQGDKALKAFRDALAITERLAIAEPGRADYQRDLSVCFNKLGAIYRTLGQGDKALKVFLDALVIAERLANAEPGRADYQRDLLVSFNNLGNIYHDLGQRDGALKAFLDALATAERLANAEPGRADYQRDLVISLTRVAATDEHAAESHLRRALTILETLDSEGRLLPTDQPMLQELRDGLGTEPPAATAGE